MFLEDCKSSSTSFNPQNNQLYEQQHHSHFTDKENEKQKMVVTSLRYHNWQTERDDIEHQQFASKTHTLSQCHWSRRLDNSVQIQRNIKLSLPFTEHIILSHWFKENCFNWKPNLLNPVLCCILVFILANLGLEQIFSGLRIISLCVCMCVHVNASITYYSLSYFTTGGSISSTYLKLS